MRAVGSGGAGSSMVQPLAIVMIVLLIGATFYLWRYRYLRSRAGFITVGAIVLGLIYVAFFTGNQPG